MKTIRDHFDYVLKHFYSFLSCVVAEAIKAHVPGCDVIFNMVPKKHAMSDIYCQLIPNEDPNIPNYEIVPRIGAFEVSIDGIVS